MLEFDLSHRRGSFVLTAAAQVGSGVTALCGPSGAGKSTLLMLLAGLLPLQQGHIRFDGETLGEAATGRFQQAAQRRFGVVFQEDLLFPHLSVRDNLLYGWRLCKPAQRRFALDEVLSLLEIGPLQERRPRQLSGGERQRVALGRALLCSPRLLLLDEPLASLDERLKQQILPYLRRVKTETGLPMLYVSHVQAEVDYLADRVLTIEQGLLRG